MRKFDPWPVFFKREWNRNWPFLDIRPYSVHRDDYRIMGSQDPVMAADKANVTEASVRGLGVHVGNGKSCPTLEA
ncbi:hypothetical protein ACE6H2_008424 [Prunus campanulata]